MTESVLYLDSSALLKLVFEEPETTALVDFLRSAPTPVSSALARIELSRIVARAPDTDVERELRRVLNSLHIVRLDNEIVAAASSLSGPLLRSLDAIHLATAQLFGPHLAGIVAYDRRLASAARDHGITVWAPH